MGEAENKLKIIIVDDDDFLVKMYSNKFTSEGVDVLSYKSGEDLISKLSEGEKVDLILLDRVLPVLDGLDILRKIREAKLCPNTPIVMLTNQSDPEGVKEAKSLGVVDYFVKSSFTPSELVENVMGIIKKIKKKK